MGLGLKWYHFALWIGFIIFMLLMPEMVSKGTLRTIIFANFLAIFAISWDILSGRTGYISFGHPFLIGIVAYTTAILTNMFDVAVEFALPLAIASSRSSFVSFCSPPTLCLLRSASNQ